jgi:hypothetical protein
MIQVVNEKKEKPQSEKINETTEQTTKIARGILMKTAL